jgi:hypothetical protein
MMMGQRSRVTLEEARSGRHNQKPTDVHKTRQEESGSRRRALLKLKRQGNDWEEAPPHEEYLFDFRNVPIR